jgi:hypothetical protein
MKALVRTLTTLFGISLGAQSPEAPAMPPKHALPESERKLGANEGGTEAQWQRLATFDLLIPNVLEQIHLRAQNLGFQGWPELTNRDALDRAGRRDMKHKLLNRFWSHPLVLWHVDREGRSFDALVTMKKNQPSDGPSYELVLIQDVFGECLVKATGMRVDPGLELDRETSLDGKRHPSVPNFIKTGAVWAYCQPPETTLPTIVHLFYPRVGDGTFVAHAETLKEHKLAIQNEDDHQCLGVFIEHLPPHGIHAAGFVWFSVAGTRYAATEEDWQTWHGKAARTRPKGTFASKHEKQP